MKLKKIRVTNFRSAEDTDEFTVGPITCLVGKNEAGKSAVLQALAGLNPHSATPFTYDKERDYPRRFLTQYESRHGGKEARVVCTEWELDDIEAEAITAEFGPEALTSRSVKISRHYDVAALQWELPVNFAKAVAHLVATSNFSAAEKGSLRSASNTQELRAALKAIEAPTEKHKRLLALIDSFPGPSITGKVTSILESHLPRFMYFSNYDRMSGEVRLDILRKQRDDKSLFSSDDLRGDRLFLEFLEFAGADLDDILAAKTYESFSAKLRAASVNITEQILEYWTQNPYIEVDVKVDAAKPGDKPPFNEGIVGRARILNTLHKADVPFSERSAGFIWFFSFLVKFAQVKDEEVPIVLLLDEPGLTLHGKAQADLLRFFEERLAPHHQIIYSTHSPFMVPPDKLTSGRIVEDLIDESGRRPKPIGTKVREDVLSSDADTIFPLQGALGYEITQTLFVGKHTLLVEGPSDILYLKSLSAALTRRNRIGLDPRWTLCPSGGIGNIRPFVSLFKGNDLNIAVLTDFAKGDKNKLENLRASNILKAGAVLTVVDFTGKPESDIEDLFEPQLFVNLVNKAYCLKGANALTVEKLDKADEYTVRLVKKAEAYFRLLPDDVPTFDHYRPAEWLIENPTFLDGDSEAVTNTLDRVAAVAAAVNPLLA